MPFIDTTKDLSALFVKQVQASPDAVALEDVRTIYTYAELDASVSALADRLRAYGIGRDSLVGVLLPRSADYVIACLAALRAGGAFLVLELAYPSGLLADVIDDAKPGVVITYRSEVGKIKGGVPLIALDESPQDINGDAKDPSPLPADDDLERLAFVAYSSGTTGKPKGIANSHRPPVLSYDLRFGVSDCGPGDRIACNVFFVWEILRPLLRGATVVAVPDETSYDPVALVELLFDMNITETLMTPTLLAAVFSRHSDLGARLPKLRTLWFNGEVVTSDLGRRAIKALPKVRLLNCYSACETHEIACGDIREMIDDDAACCPVGPPLDPKHTYILNEKGEQVDLGVSGELFVGGRMLARGYINRPELTAQTFIKDPFDTTPGALMYKTGDMARLLPSGYLEITGRVSGMIKLRGYSVVPGKVETAITSHLAVKHCAVVAHGEGLDRQLVAYVVKDEQSAANRPLVTIEETGHSPSARRALAPFLAQYMLPALWVDVPVLPTHEVSGKVDLKGFPPPPTQNNNPIAVPTIQRSEQDPITVDDIAGIWATILNIPRQTVSPEHSFFDLGGHSLTLADLASRFTKSFGVRIPVARLADPPTLSGHLATVRAIRDGETAAVQANLLEALRADSVLDEDIQPKATSMVPLNKANTVLLTGATGFLGAFLLNELLRSTSAHIICLVRFSEPSEHNIPSGIARLRKHLLELSLWNDSIMERIEIFPGNISQKRFGLTPEAFEELAARVQVVIHAAATVNLVYPYAALRNANVGGTREILRLASIGGATVQYISTNGVLPPSQQGWSEDTTLDVEEVQETLRDGYGQSKWIAEKLVQEASRRGLQARIIRVGTISGHSITGAGNSSDMLNALIVESIHLGYMPDVEGWRCEMTPVDFVSQSIVQLCNLSDANQLVFHIGDPKPVHSSQLFKDLAVLGYDTQPLNWDKWVEMWNQKRSSNKTGDGLSTVDMLRSGMPTVEFLKGIVVLNDAATRPFLPTLERPKIDGFLLETYTRHWYGRGWLPHPPLRQQSNGNSAYSLRRGPLSGKVAVVTGASSGIGAAVAAALVQEGCHVALAARRIEALDSLRRKITSSGSKIITHQTDITDKTQVAELIKATNDKLGPVDILVACAGVMYFTMMANVMTDDWERTVDVNCKGLLHCISSTLPFMLSRGTGHIVAISSDAGRKVFPGLGVYSASKFFVEATLQSLRLETAGTGLRVTSVQPGNTATELLGMSRDQEAIKKYGEPSGAKVLDPEDVAASIIYALKQPEHVAVNEILIEPRDEPI